MSRSTVIRGSCLCGGQGVAGLLDEHPGSVPDKHIFVGFLPGWDQITDTLPQYAIADLIRERSYQPLSYFAPTMMGTRLCQTSK